MPDSQVEEIKNRLDIVEIIQEYIPSMKQAGSNWKALCPFHNEKTPSFMVSRDKQIWHCFGCGEGGDVFSFIMKIEGMEFPEALKILAKKAGVVLRYEKPELINQKTKLLDILEIAAKFYHHILLNSPGAKAAREYLSQKRGLKQETIEEFNLGFAPDSWDELLKFLRNKNFKENDIFLAGLAVKKERGAGFYDRFKARIMFPVRDVHGHVVGFTGRLMPEAEGRENAGGKYINTPQTLVYDKSRVIYGLDLAKQAIRKENLSVMVEGNMDVIASHQAGIKNVVASSGTALTMAQVTLLKRYSSNLAISFDADLAGNVAAGRGIDIALREGVSIKVIILEEKIGKDPDDYIKKNPRLWREAISNSVAFMDFYIKKTLDNLDLRKIEDKKKAARTLLSELIKIPDKVEQSYYLAKLANILGVSEQILRESMPKEKNFGVNKFVSESGGQVAAGNLVILKNKTRSFLLAERILALILKYPQNLKHVVEYLEPFMVPDAVLKQIYKELVLYYNKAVDKDDLSLIFDNFFKASNNRNEINRLLLLAEKDFIDFSDEEIKDETLRSAKSLRENYILEERRRLGEEMKKAEGKGEFLRIKELTEEFHKLINI